MHPERIFAFVLILLAFSLIGFAQAPREGHKSEDPSPSEIPGPPDGMTIQEWNRTAVKDPKHLLDGPQASQAPPKPTPEEKRGIYAEAPGVESVQDDPAVVRVYPLQTLVNHATLIQVPGTVSRAWCGDLQGWTLEGEANYVSVKPLAADLSTNLHVLTADGRMENFRLTSAASGAYTDVFQVKAPAVYQPNPSQALEGQEAKLRKQLDAEYAKKLQDEVSQAREEWIRQYAGRTFFDYAIEQGRSFKVEGVFNDESFTYFRVRGDENPTLFLETRQGHFPFYRWVRELVNFNVTGGDFYRVQKLLEPGQRFVLKLRKEEVTITRKGDPR
jgi:hypothetical protein